MTTGQFEPNSPTLMNAGTDLVVNNGTSPEISAAGNIGINSFDVQNLGELSYRNWNVGVFLRWKLFDGFRTSHEVDKIAMLEPEDLRALVREGSSTDELAAIGVEPVRERRRAGSARSKPRGHPRAGG